MNGPAGTIAGSHRFVAKSPMLDPSTTRQSNGAALGLPAGGAKYRPGHVHEGYPQLRRASESVSGKRAFASAVVPTGMPNRFTIAVNCDSPSGVMIRSRAILSTMII